MRTVNVYQELGYSPFRPHMSFTGSSAPTPPAPPVPAHARATPNSGPVLPVAPIVPYAYPYSGPGEDGVGEARLAEEEARAEGDVDDALAMLLSLGQWAPVYNSRRQLSHHTCSRLLHIGRWLLIDDLLYCPVAGDTDQERGRTAVTTVLKMVCNLHNSPGDLKLRSIRVSNKAFQSKVASVPGGAALLLAAGYQYTGSGGSDGDLGSSGAVSGFNEGGVRSVNLGTDGAAAEPAEQFLVHLMDAPAVRRLRYTLLRFVARAYA